MTHKPQDTKTRKYDIKKSFRGRATGDVALRSSKISPNKGYLGDFRLHFLIWIILMPKLEVFLIPRAEDATRFYNRSNTLVVSGFRGSAAGGGGSQSQLSGPLWLRVQSRSSTRFRIVASIALLFRACFKGALDTIAPLSRG